MCSDVLCYLVNPAAQTAAEAEGTQAFKDAKDVVAGKIVWKQREPVMMHGVDASGFLGNPESR